MKPIALFKADNDKQYRLTRIEEGSRRASSKPRCPAKIYHREEGGEWSHLHTFDAEKSTANKNSAYTDRKHDTTLIEEAKEEIEWLDGASITETRRM